MSEPEKEQQSEADAGLTEGLWVNLGRVWALLRAEPSALLAIVGGLLCALFLNVIGMVENNTVGAIVDVMAKAQTEGEALAGDLKTLALIYVLQAFFAFLTLFLFQWAGFKMGISTRTRVFAAILAQPTGFFDKSTTGELTSRLTNDCQVIESNVAKLFPDLIQVVATSLLSGVYLCYLSGWLTLSLSMALPFVGVSMFVQGKTEQSLWKQQQSILTETNSKATESIGQLRTVRLFGREDHEIRAYASLQDKISNLGRKIAAVESLSSTWVVFAFNLCILVVFFTGGNLVLSGTLTGGQLIAYCLFALNMTEQVGSFPDLVARGTKVLVTVEKLFKIIETSWELQRLDKGKRKLAQIKGLIEFDRVTFSYPTRPTVSVLNQFELTIQPGMSVALVGASGSGKSTLVTLLSRLYDVEPGQGQIRIDGEGVEGLEKTWLRRNIGFINQSPTLFKATIYENLVYGLDLTDPKATLEHVKKAAALANAHAFISVLPNGYNTVVGERGMTFSGGELQRLAIARTLLTDPAILVADELSANLDNISEALVQEALANVLKGRTSIIIAHRLSTIQHCDLICVLSQGKVVEKGTFSQLIANPNGEFSKLQAASSINS